MMAIAHVATYIDQGGGSENATLNGGGTNRLLIPLISGTNASTTTGASITVGGVTAADLEDFAEDGSGTAVSAMFGHILDANHPGSGTQTIDGNWAAEPSSQIYAAVELQGASQTGPRGTTASATYTDQADGATVSVTLNGHSGKAALVYVATASSSVSASGGHTLPSGATDLGEWYYTNNRTKVGLISSVASDSEQLDFTISADGSSTMESVVVVAIPLYAVGEGPSVPPDELDVDVYLDNASSTSTLFSITGISNSTPGPGEQVTINVTNANASGKTLTCDAGSITIDSQDASTIVFTVPDPKEFGDRTLWYNIAETLTASDGAYNDVVDITITPPAGHSYDDSVSTIAGMYASISGMEVGDRAYGYWASGTGTVDLDNGSIGTESGGTFYLWIQDATDDVWTADHRAYNVYGLYPNEMAVEAVLDEASLFISPALFPEELHALVSIDEVTSTDTTLDVNDAATDVYFDVVVSTAYNGFEPEEVAVSVLLDNVTSVSGSLLMDIDTDRIRFTG